MVKKGKRNFEMKKEIPVLYHEKNECCGCAACYGICPVEAIFMYADEEGFLYPKILEEKCISCHICMQVCPFKNDN